MSDDKPLKAFDIPIVTDPTMPVNQIDIIDHNGRRPAIVNIGVGQCQKCGEFMGHGHECPSESAYWHRLPPVMEFKCDAAWPWDNMVPQRTPQNIEVMPPSPWEELLAQQKIMNGTMKAILDLLESERELRRKRLNRPPNDPPDKEIDF